MLWQRVLTAIIAAPLFFGILLCGSEPTQLFFWLIVMAIVAQELGQMLRFLGYYRFLYSALVLLFCLAGLFLSETMSFFLLTTVSALWCCYMPYLLWCYGRIGRLPLESTLLALLCTVQLVAFLVAVMRLHASLTAGAVLSLFVVVWSADIGAYFVGRKWGKTPLASTISPKKTREGFAGGIGAALLVAWIADVCFAFGVGSVAFIGLSALVAVYATIGDLWESVLKRRVGLKDSGNILPGHGGALDRIDSWLVAFPLWALGLTFWGA